MSKDQARQGNSFSKRKDRKIFLENEIASATDATNKQELLEELAAIEKAEKRSKLLKWGSVVIFLLGFTYFLYTLGDKPDEQGKTASTETVTQKTSEQKTSELTTTESETQTETDVPTESIIKELDLSESEIKAWVMAILELLPAPPTSYLLDVDVNSEDNLAYIHVGVDQLDSLGTFRINSAGQLEAQGAITGSLTNPNWTLMSDKYLDTSVAKAFFDGQDSNGNGNQSVMDFEAAKQVVEDNMALWVGLTSQELDDLEIVSFKNSSSELQDSGKGNYYKITAETNSGENFEFKVYLNGRIEQRAIEAGVDSWVRIK